MANPVAVLVGENNSGKSSVVDALRLVLHPIGDGLRPWIRISDFTYDATGVPVTDEFAIAVTLTGLTTLERGRLASCLVTQDSALITLTAEVGADGTIRPRWGGGLKSENEVEEIARDVVRYTYLPPLRDAEADLSPGRSNRLGRLLAGMAETDVDRIELEDVVKSANKNLGGAGVVKRARSGIQSRLDEILGPSYRQRTNLEFSDTKFDRSVRNLRALIGPHVPREMAESGLGYNNILFMSVLLAGMEHDVGPGLSVLLVEEPEAHLHPQLQRLLMRFLERTATGPNSVQVIVTTHSPQLASAPPIQRNTVMTRQNGATTARALRTFDIDAKSLDHLHRFLDATRAELLFARAVILVEGLAEQLLLPELAFDMGIDLVERGIAVVNVGGLAFRQFVLLFGEDRLPTRCALLTDSDPHWQVTDEGGVSEGAGVLGSPSPAAQRIRELQSEYVRPFLADRTFEWDLILAGNWEAALEVLEEIRPRTAVSLRRDFGPDAGTSDRADAFLEAVKDHKAQFAQAMARSMREWRSRVLPERAGLPGEPAPEAQTRVAIPGYIRTALEWVSAGTMEQNGDLFDADE